MQAVSIQAVFVKTSLYKFSFFTNFTKKKFHKKDERNELKSSGALITFNKINLILIN